MGARQRDEPRKGENQQKTLWLVKAQFDAFLQLVAAACTESGVWAGSPPHL